MGFGLRPGAKAPDEPPTPYRLRASPRLYSSKRRAPSCRRSRTPTAESDHVAISEIDTSAGAGAVVQDEKVTGHMKFPDRWLRNRGMLPGRCRIIRVTGDSMEPTLPNGAALLVNRGSNHRQDGKIFVIRIGEDLVVKRTVFDPEAGWLLVSDNKDKTTWATRPWPENAEVVGEVKWVARSLP